ncbi:MAG: DUF2147 domain-containing protein [Alphaproteobacteria bacterium]|nr:DUF2147 domain-containing protein [Alphaproteobacteria bacterium]
MNTVPGIAVLAGLIYLAFLHLAHADGDLGPFGVWVTAEGDAQVEIARCEDKICGTIVWLSWEGAGRTDMNTPDRERRDKPILGLRIVSDFEADQQEVGHYTGGRIYDPREGKTYRATMRVIERNMLHLRGYVGLPLLGRTAVWRRYEE